MNAKFFDLKKEKQDRMINAALKIFALNGYTHASTDEIVKEAHISKGLLFHYFESKIGVYAFIYDYCIKYYALELSTAIDPSEDDYFNICKQVEAAKMQTLRTYPYLAMFLDTCDKELHPEAVLAIEEAKAQYKNTMGTIFARADYEPINSNPNADKYTKMLDSTLKAIMADHLRNETFVPDECYKENCSYIDLIATCFK